MATISGKHGGKYCQDLSARWADLQGSMCRDCQAPARLSLALWPAMDNGACGARSCPMAAAKRGSSGLALALSGGNRTGLRGPLCAHLFPESRNRQTPAARARGAVGGTRRQEPHTWGFPCCLPREDHRGNGCGTCYGAREGPAETHHMRTGGGQTAVHGTKNSEAGGPGTKRGARGSLLPKALRGSAKPRRPGGD